MRFREPTPGGDKKIRLVSTEKVARGVPENQLDQDRAFYSWTPEGQPGRNISMYKPHAPSDGGKAHAYYRPGADGGKNEMSTGTQWDVGVVIKNQDRDRRTELDGRHRQEHSVSVYDDPDGTITVVFPELYRADYWQTYQAEREVPPTASELDVLQDHEAYALSPDERAKLEDVIRSDFPKWKQKFESEAAQ